MACSNFGGFIDAELTPSEKPQVNEWVLAQRFRLHAQTQAWLESQENKTVISEIRSLPASDGSVVEGSRQRTADYSCALAL